MQFFEKPLKNLRKHRDIKLLATEVRRNYLVSEPNYHTTKFFHRNEKKTNTPFYLGTSVLELSKIVVCEFWYDYVKP